MNTERLLFHVAICAMLLLASGCSSETATEGNEVTLARLFMSNTESGKMVFDRIYSAHTEKYEEVLMSKLGRKLTDSDREVFQRLVRESWSNVVAGPSFEERLAARFRSQLTASEISGALEFFSSESGRRVLASIGDSGVAVGQLIIEEHRAAEMAFIEDLAPRVVEVFALEALGSANKRLLENNRSRDLSLREEWGFVEDSNP